MSKLDKFIARIRSKPKDFTWKEATTLMSAYGYELKAGGKTGGSRRAFVHTETKTVIYLHEPHPGSILKVYQLKIIMESLKF